MEGDPNLQYILNIRERYELQKDKKTISLNILKRKAEKLERQEWALKTENRRRSALSLDALNNYKALKDYNENKEDIDIDIESDYLLNEGTQILSDFLYLSNNLLLTEAA